LGFIWDLLVGFWNLLENMKNSNVGIDNYSLYPLNLDPKKTLQWALDNKADGVSFSGLSEEHRKLCNKAYLNDLKQFAAQTTGVG